MWPFKWKLSTCTYTWCYLFLTILENEIWKFGRNLPLATFGSERVKETTKVASFIRKSPDYNSQPVDEREGKQPAPRGEDTIIWSVGGYASGQVMVFVLSIPNGALNAVGVCPNQSTQFRARVLPACTIWFARWILFELQGYKSNDFYVNLLYSNYQ